MDRKDFFLIISKIIEILLFTNGCWTREWHFFFFFFFLSSIKYLWLIFRVFSCLIAEIFQKFKDHNGKFKDSLQEDTLGLLSLYEASHLGANGEDMLLEAMEFSEAHLKQSLSKLEPQLAKNVSQALELPRHRRMARLEARRYIEEFGNESGHDPALLELAKLDYNKVQSLHQMELSEITR